ncbi:hypothetical protein EXS57_00260 [Candidatus Kaiserbacteria bacterium]|nr:hypothetical protein [Candidatus Kaiserbacteria bacterium]
MSEKPEKSNNVTDISEARRTKEERKRHEELAKMTKDSVELAGQIAERTGFVMDTSEGFDFSMIGAHERERRHILDTIAVRIHEFLQDNPRVTQNVLLEATKQIESEEISIESLLKDSTQQDWEQYPERYMTAATLYLNPMSDAARAVLAQYSDLQIETEIASKRNEIKSLPLVHYIKALHDYAASQSKTDTITLIAIAREYLEYRGLQA